MAEMANALAFSAYEQQSSLEFRLSPDHDDSAKHEPAPRDRDSGVFLSDDEDLAPATPPACVPSTTLTLNPSTKSTPSRTNSTRIDRLRRPAELNITSSATPDAPKPKSELELKYDLIRNSQTGAKAALKSPTQLLNDRLNLSPKKKKTHDIVRTFTPPRPMLNGCILPGPAAQIEAFTGKDVCAQTESGKSAWWCKVDKVVVFDGAEEDEDGVVTFRTRSSKGLSVARRRGDHDTVIIPMDCQHCQQMLNRSEWKYDIQVCRRSVCWDCKQRCRWEQARKVQAEKTQNITLEETKLQTEGNRVRADSVLQDEQVQEEDLMKIVGIEMGLKSPIETLGGIDERLEEMVHRDML
jgi:hypothetical protein